MDYKKEDLDNDQLIIIKYNNFISLAHLLILLRLAHLLILLLCVLNIYIYLIFIIAKD